MASYIKIGSEYFYIDQNSNVSLSESERSDGFIFSESNEATDLYHLMIQTDHVVYDNGSWSLSLDENMKQTWRGTKTELEDNNIQLDLVLTSDETVSFIFVIEIVDNDHQVCFLEGTKIATDQGLVAVEHLTRDNSVCGCKVNNVTKSQNIFNHLIHFKPHSLMENVPSEDTYVSPTHAIYCPYEKTLKMAMHFYNGEQIVKDESKKNRNIYNVLLEKDDALTYHALSVNNMLCESLNPNVYHLVNSQFKFPEKLSEEDRDKISQNKNKIIKIVSV